MKRVLSGIKPTGDVTLGNYLGAMKRWAAMSRQEGVEHFWFIPNLHALTMRPDPAELTYRTRSTVAWLMAAGIDPATSYIFVQSQIPAHSELTWILNNYVTMGELGRMTQYKDKALKNGIDGQVVGLYDYPVLMAADILLYDADEVPVGEDQKQHVELTRDIATRFNNLHGDTFRIPEPTVQAQGARIMDLQDPSKKMSKSDQDSSGCILLTDDPSDMTKKIVRAVTDNGSEVSQGADKPALTNLLTIHSIISGVPITTLEETYAGRGYGEFKTELAKALVDELEPIQHAHSQLMKSGNEKIDQALEHGWWRASELANAKLAEVKEKLGLV